MAKQTYKEAFGRQIGLEERSLSTIHAPERNRTARLKVVSKIPYHYAARNFTLKLLFIETICKRTGQDPIVGQILKKIKSRNVSEIG